MKTNQINWLAIIIEAFFLVLGIGLALAANNWREDQKKSRSAALAMESIAEELITNHEAISKAITYHSHLMDTLYKHMGAYPDPSGTIPGIELFTKGFMSPAAPLSGAWEAALATGVIENASYDNVRMISQVYEMQEQYGIQNQSMSQQIYGRMFSEGAGGILRNYRNLAQVIGAFVYTECGLASEYARVVPVIKSDSTALVTPIFCSYLPPRER